MCPQISREQTLTTAFKSNLTINETSVAGHVIPGPCDNPSRATWKCEKPCQSVQRRRKKNQGTLSNLVAGCHPTS